MSEQITNLSWLLEEIAKRLDQLAARIRTEESKGREFDRSPKAVQEALLQLIGSSGSAVDSADVEKLLNLLEKQAKPR